MDMRTPREIIRVIEAERERRDFERSKVEHPDFAYDQWLFTDGPFVGELCLVLLVAIRHQLERELVHLAARMTPDGSEIDGREFKQGVASERESLRGKNGWPKLIDKLQLKDVPEWNSSMRILQLLANSYKHNPWGEPDEKLLGHLRLDKGVNYAPLPASLALLDALVESLGLQDGTDHCDLAREMLARVDRFLADVKERNTKVAEGPKLSPVRWGPVSMNPKDFAH